MAVMRTPIAATTAFDLDALKLHARVDFDDDDISLTMMGNTAAAELESHCELALLRQQISFSAEADGNPVSLPIGPLLEASAITVNGSPAAVTITSSGRYPVIVLPDEVTGTVVISYQAGYGDTVDDIPADLQLAILDHASRLYDMRGSDDGNQGLSVAAARIAARHRQVKL